MENKWSFLLISVISLFLLATSSLLLFPSSSINSFLSVIPSDFYTNQSRMKFVEKKLRWEGQTSISSKTTVPRFAYLISGSKGDLEKLWRTLCALYHPWNFYIIHLDLESPAVDRLELVYRVGNNSVFSTAGNVQVVSKANMVTYRGPTMVSNTLHACAMLLKERKKWDWFINLSASDYPLVTQDDLLYTFSSLNRHLNFVEHTSNLGWKRTDRAMPLILDPGLYSITKKSIYWVSPRRPLPTEFKLFTGSAWMVLSRSFVEYVIWGWNNLPRTLLMYYTNFISSPEGYFHTVLCNAPEFVSTVINHDLHFITWDNPPKQHPHILTRNHTEQMIASGAAFARKFKHNTPVLDTIDTRLLQREEGTFTPGGWCAGDPKCSKIGDPTELRPGPGAERLGRLVGRAVLAAKLGLFQCS